MRRCHIDAGSQPQRNLLLNPSFETAGSTVAVRTNQCTNPAMVATTGQAGIRTNLCLNPRGVNAFVDYSGAGNQTITANVAITGHPEGFTTANRVSYTAGGANPGVTLLNPLTSGQTYTISAWVWHEAITSTPGSCGFAQAGVTSQPGSPTTAVSTAWTRVSWTYTASGTSQFGYRVSGHSGTGTGSFLITGVLIERSAILDHYFDGTTTTGNLVTNPSFATNTTGWTPISATLNRVTNQGGDGHVGELTQTITDGTRNTAIWIMGGSYPAGDYTVSFDMKGTDASFTNVRSLLYDTATTLVRASANTPLIKDGNFNRYTFTFTADGVFDRVYMEVQGVGIPIGAKAWLDRAVIEKGKPSNFYYEGLGPYTYVWGGTEHASISYKRLPAITSWSPRWWGSTGGYGWTGQVPGEAPNGGTAYRKFWTIANTGNSLDTGIQFSRAVTAGAAYTASIYQRSSFATNITPFITWKDAGGATISATTTTYGIPTPAGVWTRYHVTATAPTGAVTGEFTFGPYRQTDTTQAAPTPAGGYIDWAQCLIEQTTATPGTYFDGSTAAITDYTFSWTSTANGSNSEQRGTRVGTYIGGAAHALQSTEWTASGTYSCRHVSTYPSAGSAYIDLKTTGSLTPGQTYTLLATCRIAAAATTTPDRKLAILMYGAGAHKYTTIPNTPGVYPLRLTFTLPATGLTSYYLRLYNGGVIGEADCWWDNLMLAEGDYAGDYIETGPAYPPQLYDIAGKPSLDLVGVGNTSGTIADPFAARTLYYCYDAVSATQSWGSFGSYGSATIEGFTFQGMEAGNTGTAPRWDFPGGTQNATTVIAGSRTSRVHVTAIALNQGLTGITYTHNGAADVTRAIANPGNGLSNHRVQGNSIADGKALRILAFMGEHDRATRVAISRYLGNKYGANVA